MEDWREGRGEEDKGERNPREPALFIRIWRDGEGRVVEFRIEVKEDSRVERSLRWEKRRAGRGASGDEERSDNRAEEKPVGYDTGQPSAQPSVTWLLVQCSPQVYFMANNSSAVALENLFRFRRYQGAG